jgi:hypothetical protein
MKRTTALKLGVLIPVIIVALALSPFRNWAIPYLQPAFFAMQQLPIMWILVAVIAAMLLYMIFGRKLELRHKLWSVSGLAGDSKIYPVNEHVQACHEYMKPSGIHERSLSEGGGGLSLKATVSDSPESDVPLCLVMLSTSPRKEGERQPVSLQERLSNHFFIVDRRTNEVSYDPDVNTMAEAFRLKAQIRRDSMPAEKKRSATDRLSEGIIKGYTSAIGGRAAEAVPEENHESKNNKEEGD